VGTDMGFLTIWTKIYIERRTTCLTNGTEKTGFHHVD
jgi:hypothetical protein